MSTIKVSELNKYIKKYISMDYLLNQISVEGEISNFKHHSNGNFYFSLKDERARINTIMYREEVMELSFVPVDGMQIVATGTISFFESHGQMNFYVKSIEKIGSGNLYQQFLVLKERLDKKGYFLQEHKKPLPKFPKTVGIITSDTGAAVQDIINVLQQKNNLIHIIVYPAFVQGQYAVNSMIQGIEYFNLNPVDVIILGRGGGSFEDLFAFNDEKLADAIYNSDIPIISAVGHEIDYSISDFVADVRAATPTKAAEMVSISKEDLIRELQFSKVVIQQNILKKLEETKSELEEIANDFSNLYLWNRIKEEYNSLTIVGMQLREKIIGKNQVQTNRLKSLSFYMTQTFQNNLYRRKYMLWENIQNLLQTKLYFDQKISQGEDILHSFSKQLLYSKQMIYEKKNDLKLFEKELAKALYWKLRENRASLHPFYEKIEFFKRLVYETFRTQLEQQRDKLQKMELSRNIQKEQEQVESARKTLAKEFYIKQNQLVQHSLQGWDEKLTAYVLSKIENEKRMLEISKLKLFQIYQNMNRIELFFEDGREVTKLIELSKDDHLKILFKDGFANVTVNDIKQLR